MHRSHRSFAPLSLGVVATFAALASLGGCGSSGTTSTPIGGVAAQPELLLCRARVDDPNRFAEIAIRSRFNLSSDRVAERAGTELHARVHPDGNRVVFARERDRDQLGSRELYSSSRDGTIAELRLTQNDQRDDEPCWSPDGNRILFTGVRNGAASLLVIAADGAGEQPFVLPPAGFADGEADWHRATDRIVWSRRDTDGRHVLWLAFGSGSGAMPLTDGGPTIGNDTGDRAPAFAPDGQTIAFVRRNTASTATLCLANVQTGTVTTRFEPAGDVDFPRFADGSTLLFGVSQPLVGRPTLRLARIGVANGDPVLLWPDARWRLGGIDVLPGFPGFAAGANPTTLDVTRASLQFAAGTVASGTRDQLQDADGREYVVTTATIDGREVAGINLRFDLPVAAVTDIVDYRVRILARSTRVGGDSALRTSLYNPVDERFDTVVERVPANTDLQTLEFRAGSLRHVTSERQLRFTVIADLAPGARAELRIDQVLVELVQAARP
jgi:hypothetical protein